MKRITVVGSSNIDFVLRVEDMPRKGETIRTKSFEKIPGGKGANQACAVGKLGGDCTFLSAVGRDGLGELVMQSLKNANVKLDHVLWDENTPTGMAVIAVNDDGENSIMIVPGANNLCSAQYFARHRSCIEQTDILLTQLETPLDDIYALIQTAKEMGKIVVMNPAPAPEMIPDDVLCGLDFITPNETELEKITGMKTETIPQIKSAAGSLLARGVKNVIVTIGSRGALLCNSKEELLYPAYPAAAVDTTAAGDTFNAGVVVGLAEGMPLGEAIQMGNAAASISITRKGAQTSIPTRREAEQLCNSIRK